jgi:hypothetical protein
LDGACEARGVRDAQAQAAERGPEPLFPAADGGAVTELDRERAAGHRPPHAGQPEGSREGDGLEGRPPGFTGEKGDVVRAQPAVQQGPRGRLGLVRRVEERDEQDLGRPVEGAHDSLIATKR